MARLVFVCGFGDADAVDTTAAPAVDPAIAEKEAKEAAERYYISSAACACVPCLAFVCCKLVQQVGASSAGWCQAGTVLCFYFTCFGVVCGHSKVKQRAEEERKNKEKERKKQEKKERKKAEKKAVRATITSLRHTRPCSPAIAHAMLCVRVKGTDMLISLPLLLVCVFFKMEYSTPYALFLSPLLSLGQKSRIGTEKQTTAADARTYVVQLGLAMHTERN